MRRAPSASGLWRRLASLSITLLFVLLPFLAAGARIDRPAGPEELRRIRTVLTLSPAEGHEPGSIPARWFFRAMLPERIVELGPQSLDSEPTRTQAVICARRVSLLGVLLISCALYLTLASARGALVGLCACAAFAALPPIAVEGAVLRPEIPAVGTALLAFAVLLTALVLDRTLRAVPGQPRLAVVMALLVASGALAGAAAAFVPQAWWLVMVPSAMLVLTIGSLLVLSLRHLRRHGTYLPLVGLARRLALWLAAMLLWPALCVLMLVIGYDPATREQAFSVSEVGLLPSAWPAKLVLVVLAGVGALRWFQATGRRLARGTRLSSETVLMVLATLLLAQHTRARVPEDALFAAAALAMLIGEGSALCARIAMVRIVARLR